MSVARDALLRRERASVADVTADLPAEQRDSFWALLAGVDAAGTSKRYGNTLQHYVSFCARHRLVAVPAAPATVVQYLLHLQREDRVHGGTLRQYTAAIRRAHELAGFAAPQEQPVVSLAIRAYQRLTDTELTRLNRVPIDTAAVCSIVQYGASAARQGDWQKAIAAAAIVFQFVFFARSVTTRAQLMRHVQLEAQYIRVTLTREKGKRPAWRSLLFTRTVVDGLTQEHPFDFLLTVLRHQLARAAQFAFSYGQQAVSSHTLSQWWRDLPAAAGCSMPAVGRWTPHSGRSGGASAAIQAGAPSAAVQQRGGWQSAQQMHGYVHSVARHPADFLFFGHLSPLVRPFF